MALPAIPPRIAAGLVGLVLAWSLQSPCHAAQKSALPQQVGPTAVQKALDQGSAWLLKRIESASSSRHGEFALMAYAAVEGGIDPAHPSLLKWADERAQYPATGTYEAACLLLALAAIDPQRYSAAIEFTASQLMHWQNPRGDWGYPSGADLSCTQFAALGLWRARQLGYPVPSESWLALAKRTRAYRDSSNGGFSYNADGSSRVSMTLAGVGIYALCESELRAAGEWNKSAQAAWIDARDAGLSYLEDRFGPLEQKMSDWGFYSFYGLERVGAWLGIDQIGAHAWYQRGANLLVPQQLADGSWQSNHVNTSFAVLFLARATSGTRQRLAFTSGSTKSVVPDIEDDQVCWLTSEGNGPEMKISVDRWQWRAMQAYEHSGERGQGARVSFIELLVNGEVHAVQLLDETRAIGNRRLRFKFVPSERASYEVKLAFHVVRPKSAPHLPEVLYSAPLQVVALRGLAKFTGVDSELMLERPSNRLRQAGATASVSSRLQSKVGLPQGSHGGESLLDGSAQTAWMPRVRDEKQRVIIRVAGGVKTRGLTVTRAQAIEGGKALARPRLLEIRVNGGELRPLLIPLHEDEASLEFGELIEIRELEVKVRTWAQPEGQERAPGGLAEVDLLSLD